PGRDGSVLGAPSRRYASEVTVGVGNPWRPCFGRLVTVRPPRCWDLDLGTARAEADILPGALLSPGAPAVPLRRRHGPGLRPPTPSGTRRTGRDRTPAPAVGDQTDE